MKNHDWLHQEIQKFFLKNKEKRTDHLNKKNTENNTHEERKQVFLEVFSAGASQSSFWRKSSIDLYFQLIMATRRKEGLNDE